MTGSNPTQPVAPPVAIVGMACRLPGAPDPEAFWRLLRDGGDAVRPVPPTRWPHRPGGAPYFAGLLEDVDTFDADFFGIAPREAVAMDPQQRLMLELAWEAAEDADIRPAALAGSRTAVFTGAIWGDYATVLRAHGTGEPGRHTMAGTQRGIIANRVSHRLGLRGPSLTVDAAQSSGLVAVHLACASLHSGEADLAFAGGVNLLLTPESTHAAEAQFQGLSPDGRCHTFDARANGFVRGEGGGMVLLKPLAAALADGDPVYCVIEGSALNNDGATDGLTRPSAQAQADVLRQAWRRAAVTPADLHYVELHGTGTPVGDPVEAAALGAALGGRREDAPLRVGSVKTNLGHLEAAAGIAGLVKTALSIHHRTLPPSLHFTTPHPDIPLDALGLRVQTACEPWPDERRRLTAGVSSFGMGGTNCHVVLAEPPAPAGSRTEAPAAPAVTAWPLSAAGPQALAGQAAALRRHLEARPGDHPVDVGHALATARTVFPYRAVVLGEERGELLAGLDALAAGTDTPDVVRGRAGAGRVAFLFSGQGSQRPGMGAGLAAAHPVFAAALEEVCAHLDPLLGTSLLEVMTAGAAPDGDSPLARTEFAQPALFAHQTALYRLVESWGVRPDHVMGHSVGEITAAHVAGVLSLPDACALVAARGRLMQTVTTPGAMAAWQASAEEADRVLAGYEGRLGPAAVNAPGSVVVSGDRDAVEAATAAWRDGGRRATLLKVGQAFHSAHLDPVLADLRAVAAGLAFAEPAVPVVSNVTGAPATGDDLRSPGYWAEHARRPVLFGAGVRHLCDAGVDTFLELGPDASLTGMVREVLAAAGGVADPAAAIAAQRRGRPEARAFASALAALHVRGVDVDWPAATAGHAPRRVPLPTYAFQRERHWPETAVLDGDRSAPVTVPQVDDAHVTVPQTADLSPGALLALVRRHTALVLGHSGPDRVDPALTFRELGFDSLAATELSEALGAATGVPLPATLTFDHPTPHAVAAWLGTGGEERPEAAGGPAGGAGAGRDGDPVAVVAMACRYPGGVDSAEALWRLVDEGADAVGAFPTDRGWDPEELFGRRGGDGGSDTDRGGFLHDAGEFDAEFFGISPREALAMDPQQRVLLELSWTLLERAGIAPASLEGSATGVFVGATPSEYGPHLHEAAAEISGHLLTGVTPSVVSGRVAYALGLQGPALTVDTACSSSLVAMHLAARALRDGDCDLALAGGVTVMATPGMFTSFSRQGGLAADGRCKPFAAAADGTGWAEGAGLVLLERLSDARRNGHRVLAVLRGSAINQDGASNGLTAPNGLAQQRVVRRALADSGLTPSEVDAVEAHGTGTTLGDPIEARALMATYGQDRPGDRPLLLGSVKSNIGHTQAAAGVAGVIKMVMAMRHGRLPASLHVDAPSPHVAWDGGGVALLAEAVDWPETGRPRRAAVSSFGISGTNAHVVLEQAPTGPESAPEQPSAPESAPEHAPAPDAGGVVPWVLSARTAGALRARAGELLAWADGAQAAPAAPAETGWSLATTRSADRHRAVVGGADAAELLAGLRAMADGPEAPAVSAGAASGAVMVFPGQGSQWLGMGVELLDSSPVFAARVAACDEALAEFTGWSLTAVLRGAPDAPDASRVDVLQPCLWAVMVSLAAVWEDFGVRPAAVIGHSQGEIAAACVAGGLSLRDGARIVALRSRALRALAGDGTMASLALSGEETADLLARLGEPAVRVTAAAFNGPFSTVVSGPTGQVAAVVAACEAAGNRARTIDVDYASHGPQVDRIADVVRADLEPVRPGASGPVFYSSVTAGPLGTQALDADYWFTNLRQPVRFASAVDAALADGYRVFVEVSPHPVLVQALRECAEAADAEAVTVPTLRRDEGGPRRLVRALGEGWAAGLAVDWSRWFDRGRPPRTVELPTYPFQRQRYWLTAEDGRGTPRATGAGTEPAGHPLLASAVELADGGLVLNGLLSAGAGGTDGHTVAGVALVPGAVLVEWALSAADRVGGADVEELLLRAPLEAPGEAGGLLAQVAVGAPDASGRRALRISSRPAAGGTWTCHAEGTLLPAAPGDGDAPTPSAHRWPPAGATAVDLTGWYERAERLGYGYGPGLRGVRAVWRDGEGLVAEVELPEAAGADDDGFALHPVLLDCAVQCALLADGDGADDGTADRLWLPFAWSGVRLRATGARAARVRLTPLGGTAEEERELRVTVSDPAGAPVLEVASVVLRARTARQVREAAGPAPVEWTPVPPREAPDGNDDAGPVAVLGDGTAPGADRYADVPALLAALAGGAPAPRALVWSAPAGPVPDDGSEPAAVRDAAELLRAWRAAPRLAETPLVLLTRDAVAPGGAPDGPADPAGAALWDSLGGPLAPPRDRLVLVDLGSGEGGDGNDPVDVARWASGGEPRIALRSGTALAPRPARPVAARRAPARPVAAAPKPVAGWADRLAGLAPAERRRAVRDWVREHTAAVLGLESGGAVRPDAAFKELGIDSMTAVELRDRLTRESGVRLPVSVVFRHPTPDGLARRIEEQLTPAAPEPDGVRATGGPATGLPAAGVPEGPDGPDRPGDPEPAARATADRLASASADELLDFIDNELDALSDAPPRSSR